MKRIISILIAVMMIASLIPATFAANEEAETISYVIKTTSIKTDAFTAVHKIPLNDNGTLKVSKSPAATFSNVIKNLSGNWAGDSSPASVANTEISFMTYKDVDYYMHGSTAATPVWTPIRHPLNSYTLGNGTSGLEADGTAPKKYKMPASLNDTTAPFDILGKPSQTSHFFIDSDGLYCTYSLGTPGNKYSGFRYFSNGTKNEFAFIIKLKIPETAKSGNYTINFLNNLKGKTNHYGDAAAAKMDVYVTKVGAEGFECLYTNSTSGTGTINEYTDASGNVLSHDAYALEANKLSETYLSHDGVTQEFDDVRYFEAGSEYIFYFVAQAGSVDKEKLDAKTAENVYYDANNTAYQNFKISGIDLVPVKEEVPPALEQATIVYDAETKKVSVASAVMNNGEDATGYTVTYGMTGAQEAKINPSTGIVTPGSENETVSLWADVTLDDVTVRATLANVMIKGYVEGRLEYIIGADALNADARVAIAALDGDASLIRNTEMNLISWKDISYVMNGTVPLKVAPGTEGATTIRNILNLNITDKYELPGRSIEDNAPRFLPKGLNTQFVARRFDAGKTEPTSQSYLATKLSSRPKYMIKVYVPEKGVYKLSVANNFTLEELEKIQGASFIAKSGDTYTSLGREAWTEVYFTKAKYDLPYEKTAPSLYDAQLEELLCEENKVGWYDSGSYGKVTNYEKLLVAPEAGEYYVTFSTCPESYEKNPNIFHRIMTNGVAPENELESARCDYQIFSLSEIRLTPVEEDAEYEKTFDAVEENYITSGSATVTAYTYTDKEESLSLNNVVALGETYSASAPEKEGYNFLYWAKGGTKGKQVVSYERSFTYKPSEGNNFLIAVYEKEGAEVNKAEFYNANGSLIETLTTDGKTPKYPSMAGYGEASGWQLYGSDDVYAADVDIAVSGNMIFVAKYAETPNKVIVNGTEYTYGDTVVMPEVDTTKIFKGWKRNGEIVSVDPNYTFKAWEDASVEAVYAEEAPAFSGKFVKIVLDSFDAGNKDAIMAEFIGIEDAIEKGVMFDNKKVPMKGNGNQFTIIADEEDVDYIGYAVIKDGNAFTQITDGKVSK